MSVLGIYRVLPKSQPLLCDSPGSWLKWPSVHQSVGQCHLLAGSVSPSPGLDSGCLSPLPGTAGDTDSCPASRSCLCGGHLFHLSSVEKSVFSERNTSTGVCYLLDVPCSLCSPCGWTLECPTSLLLPCSLSLSPSKGLWEHWGLWIEPLFGGLYFFLSFYTRGK